MNLHAFHDMHKVANISIGRDAVPTGQITPVMVARLDAGTSQAQYGVAVCQA